MVAIGLKYAQNNLVRPIKQKNTLNYAPVILAQHLQY